jgi:hypothetical protein
LKCRALTKKSWIDDLEIEEEGVADILMGIVIPSFICLQMNMQSIMLQDQALLFQDPSLQLSNSQVAFHK